MSGADGDFWKSIQGTTPLGPNTEVELEMTSSRIGHVSVGVAKKMENYETYAHCKMNSFMFRLDGDFCN